MIVIFQHQAQARTKIAKVIYEFKEIGLAKFFEI